MLGTLLGNYRVVEKLGEGGMGVVYVGLNETLGRRVAVKVLQPELSNDAGMIKRFVQEAQAATAIHNPGIVQVFDFGATPEGRAYFVMELLGGESLSARLKRQRQRLSYEECCRIGRQVANVLQSAHTAGITHRDLKPDNLFLVPDPEVTGGERVKVLDFGLAKLTGDSHPSGVKTRTGLFMGTPNYMSPEQCRKSSNAEMRSDIYSLGCILFRMTCGRPPFVGEGLGDIVAAHLHVAPPNPRSIKQDMPPELSALITRMLAKNPDERPQTMTAVSQELERFQWAFSGSAMQATMPMATLPALPPPTPPVDRPPRPLPGLPPPSMPEPAPRPALRRAPTQQPIPQHPPRPEPALPPAIGRTPTQQPIPQHSPRPEPALPPAIGRPRAPTQQPLPQHPPMAEPAPPPAIGRAPTPQPIPQHPPRPELAPPPAIGRAPTPKPIPQHPLSPQTFDRAQPPAPMAPPAPLPMLQIPSRPSTISGAAGVFSAQPYAGTRRRPYMLGGLVIAGAATAIAIVVGTAGSDSPDSSESKVSFEKIPVSTGSAIGAADPSTADAALSAALADAAVNATGDAAPPMTADELVAECKGSLVDRKWAELAQCAEKLQPLDPKRAAELATRAAEEAKAVPQIAAVEAALRDKHLLDAKAALDQISAASVEYPSIKHKYDSAEAQAIAELAAQLERVAGPGCGNYTGLLGKARTASPPRVAAEATRRAPCPSVKCDADALAEKGKEQFATNRYADALASFEAAYACRPAAHLIEKAFAAACNLRSVPKAKRHWKQLPAYVQSRTLTICVRNGIIEATLNAP